MEQSYNHKEIEKKWQEIWEKKNIFKADDNSKKPKKYVLDMFPYPSAAGLHVGHPEGYTATDIYSRYLRMNGYEVIHPMGWDAFGLPAENYAIQINVHPKKSIAGNIKTFSRQIKSFGFSYDWDREINTSDPEYYKWSQWFFLLLYKNGLAYKKKAPVNWCESCKTVLANEQVIDGKCERCKNEVVQKDLEQWFFKVTQYSEELLEGLDRLEWSESLKTMQRNWIGKSEGALIEFPISNSQFSIKDYKTVYFASGNKSKFKRLKPLFKKINPKLKIKLVPDYIDAKEDGKDGFENSLKKVMLYKGKYDCPVIAMDTAVFFEGPSFAKASEGMEDFDPLCPKRSCLEEGDEDRLNQEQIAEKMLNFYKNIAKKNGGEKEFYYEDYWTILLPDGNYKQIKYKREYILTDKQEGKLNIYFPMRNLYYSKITGKRFFENTDEDFFKEFECQTNALKELTSPKRIKVFTTRPDTLYGATYMVLAPEHKLVQEFKDDLPARSRSFATAKAGIKNFDEVQNYINKTKKKSDLERTDLAKEKTGVKLKGIMAVNPVNNKEIPIFISDYVLASYGTGAIMCVPAHDQRDFEFAKRFNLPIPQVIRHKRKTKVLILHGFGGDNKKNWHPWIKKELEKLGYKVIQPNMPESDKPVLKKWLKALEPLIQDFTEDDILIGHSLGAFALMHLIEKNNVKVNKLFLIAPVNKFMLQGELSQGIKDNFTEDDIKITSKFISNKIDYKRVDNNVSKIYCYFSDNDPYITLDQKEKLEKVLNAEYKVFKNKGHFSVSEKIGFNITELPEILPDIEEQSKATEVDGIMINSGKFNGMDSEKAKVQITKKAKGKLTVQYKIRDWLVSRQRYWGAPIPIIYCDKCGIVPVPEKDLPVLLPDDIDDFRPTGKPPLAFSKTFNKVKCPKCGADAKRELDTMDGFVDNSWYYYRYLDSKNNKEFCSKDKIKKWMPVDIYVGGAEHAVGHLIYSRFFTKVLRDNKYLDFDEPFLKLINQGLVLGENGQKMSKSLGNVINPDDIIEEYGADSFRMYEMFMGPLEDIKPWSIDGIKGQRRFLDRNWSYFLTIRPSGSKNSDPEGRIKALLHKTIKKVTEDIENFRFNTAISSLMIYFKELSQLKSPSKDLVNTYLILLSCFAPHITEEIWERLSKVSTEKRGNKDFICKQEWPKYDESLIKEETINLPIQVNGKLRDTIEVEVDISENELKEKVFKLEKIKKYTEDKKIIKFIYIKGKIVNIVVK